jgi:hypothetical protein
MNSIAILVRDMNQNQCAFYATNKLNEWFAQDSKRTGAIYYENLAPFAPLQPNFPLMNIMEAFNFDGVMIATDLSTAAKMLNMPGPKRRIFYTYDLEWLRFNPKRSFEELAMLYRSPRLELWARSESHKKIIENNFNREVNILEEFNFSRLEG